MRLSQKDLTLVSTVLRDLYAHTDASTLPHRMIKLLRCLIEADSAGYNHLNFQNHETVLIHDHGREVDQLLPVLEAMVDEHPLAQHQHLRGQWRQGAAKISDFLSHRCLRDTAIYHEWLHPLRIEDQLGVYIEETGRVAIAVTLQRDRRAFTARDRQVLTLLQPHLMQAFKNAADLTAAKSVSARFEQTLNGSALGVIWLAEHFEIDWMSTPARDGLDRYFASQRRGERSLPAPLLDWTRSQHQLWRTTGNLDRQTPLTLDGEHGRLTIRWISESPERSYLLLSEERRAPHSLISLGLTPREAEVLHWLAEGKSNESIGIILGIASRTAEKHVQNILAKLGVENRVEAAMRACELSGRIQYPEEMTAHRGNHGQQP